MIASPFIQLIAACAGVLGSLFFAIGVMRQSRAAMADLSGTYVGWNPHLISALAAQKADYLFGGGLIVVAFGLQLASFLVSASWPSFASSNPAVVAWSAAAVTVVLFFLLQRLARCLASRFEAQITARLQEKDEELRLQREERSRARQRGA